MLGIGLDTDSHRRPFRRGKESTRPLVVKVCLREYG